ncbi:MAG: hypothetical protein ACKO63_17470 [Nodosilinea sp.]
MSHRQYGGREDGAGSPGGGERLARKQQGKDSPPTAASRGCPAGSDTGATWATPVSGDSTVRVMGPRAPQASR